MKPYGIEGELVNFPYNDYFEVIQDDNGIEITIKDGILSAGYTFPEQKEKAMKTALRWLAAWNLRQRWSASVKFNREWSVGDQGSINWLMTVTGVVHSTSSETITIERRVHIDGTACIITQQMTDSKSFANDAELASKAARYPELDEALLHFHFEAAPNDRPLYGIYKALESITKTLDQKRGREVLAQIVGKDFDYVNDVMKTANATRHAMPNSDAVLDEKECRERAAWLITEYARSLA